MKRAFVIVALLYAIGLPMIALSAPCPANLPFNPGAMPVQGGDPTGLLGWPIAVTSACPLDVNVVSGGGSCVTQCTSPWVVSGTVTANQGTSPWIVSGTVNVGNFPATTAVTQSTSPWIVGFGGVRQPVDCTQTTSPWVVSGTVSVGNFPATTAVTQSTSPWVVGFGGVGQPVNCTQTTSPWVVSGTVTSNQGAPPWSVTGTLTNNGAAPTSNNVGVLPSVANAAAPTLTEGRQSFLSTDLAGNLRTVGSSTISGTATVQGSKTDNNAAPGATNVGALVGVANAAAPTRTEGNQVLVSTDLNGYTRVIDNHNISFVTASLTRPNNTTAYTIGDGLTDTGGGLLTFSGCARINGGTGRIAQLFAIDEANQTTKINLECQFFDNTVTATTDNAAVALSNADAEKDIGALTSNVTATLNAGAGALGNLLMVFQPIPVNANATLIQMGIPFKCQAGSTSLYCVPIVKNAYVPIASEKFVFRLAVIQD